MFPFVLVAWHSRKAIWLLGAMFLLLLLLFNLPLLRNLGYRNLAARSLGVALATGQPSHLSEAGRYAAEKLHNAPVMAAALNYRIGVAYQQMGMGEAATAHYEKALQTSELPADQMIDLLFRLGVFKYEAGDHDAASAYFQQLLEIEPSVRSLQAVAHANVYLGMILGEQTGDLSRQRRYLETALGLLLDGFTMNRYLALVGTMRDLAEYRDQALEMVMIAVERDPESTWAALARCRVHESRQELDEAVLWCQRAVELEPSNHHAHVWLGLAYSYQVLWEQALSEFEIAARLAPDNGWYLDLIEKAKRNLAGNSSIRILEAEE